MKNTNALLGAQHRAEQIAKDLHLAFWLRDQAPNSAAYLYAGAQSQMTELIKLMGEIDTAIVEESVER